MTALLGPERERLAGDVFTVSSGGTTLAGGFDEELVDADGDGLADALAVDVGLDVAEAGTYRAAARLVDSSGRMVASAGATGELAVGSRELRLAFSGRDLFLAGHSGPFRLVDVAISRGADSPTLEDEAEDLGLTAAHDVLAFEHFPVELNTESFAHAALDSDSDGLYDVLRLTGELWVAGGGDYQLRARLADADDELVTSLQTSVTLDPGDNSLSLDFDGIDIGAAALDGPYLLSDLSLVALDDPDRHVFVPVVQMTGPYEASQFESGPMTFERLRTRLRVLADSGDVSPVAFVALDAKLVTGQAAREEGQVVLAKASLDAFRTELALHRDAGQVSQVAYDELDDGARDLGDAL